MIRSQLRTLGPRRSSTIDEGAGSRSGTPAVCATTILAVRELQGVPPAGLLVLCQAVGPWQQACALQGSVEPAPVVLVGMVGMRATSAGVGRTGWGHHRSVDSTEYRMLMLVMLVLL